MHNKMTLQVIKERGIYTRCTIKRKSHEFVLCTIYLSEPSASNNVVTLIIHVKCLIKKIILIFEEKKLITLYTTTIFCYSFIG